MLKVDNLSFSYQNNEKIIKELNLIIEREEFAGIIGPNGSGKSTFIKNLSNLFEPDDGVIYLEGRKLNRLSASELARQMAVVPQQTVINFNFSVYDLVMMGRNPYQDRWGSIDDNDRQVVEEALTLTDTRQFRSKSIDQLSGGERQRVIIARALAQSPEILLLDEPTSSLDINYQGEIFDLLSYLNNERELTIVVVSHDLNLSGQYCQRLILFEEGEIYAAGTPENVLTEDNINEVYDANVIIKDNQFTGRPFITVMPGEYSDYHCKFKSTGCIHLICGGGNAKNLLQKLYFHGFRVSCGVINKGDSDWDLAKDLGFEMVDIDPFAYIDENALQRNKEKISSAEVVLVSDLPFGHGNLDNLIQLKEFDDKDIIMLNKRNIARRDYTEGKAIEVWQDLVEKDNVYTADSEDEMMNKIFRLLDVDN